VQGLPRPPHEILILVGRRYEIFSPTGAYNFGYGSIPAIFNGRVCRRGNDIPVLDANWGSDMKFFLRADDPKIAEQSYQTIKKFNEKQIGWPISDARYYEIRYSHNGQDLYARVGEPDPLNGETVIAIFKPKHAQSPFLVCTYIGSDARDMYVDRAVEGVEPLVLQEIHDRLARHDTPAWRASTSKRSN
jgi:hypothetical protein